VVGQLGQGGQRPAADALHQRVGHGQADVGHRVGETGLDDAADLGHPVDDRHRRAGHGADAAGQRRQEAHRQGNGDTHDVGAELGRLPQDRLDVGRVGLDLYGERAVGDPAGLLDLLDGGDEVGDRERGGIEGDDGSSQVAVDLDPLHGVESDQRRLQLAGEVLQFGRVEDPQLEVSPFLVDPRPARPGADGADDGADEVEQTHRAAGAAKPGLGR
jgi:hypothetical protein